jgi:AcrR family transcriptional regulator
VGLVPKVPEQHLADRREQILQAAQVCFASKGFHRTTMQDICTEAGLSAGAVYHYFAGKEEIIAACCARASQRVQLVFDASMGNGQTADVLRQMIALFAGDLSRPGAAEASRAAVNTWGEAVVNPSLQREQRAALDNAIAFLTGLARAAQDAGEFSRSVAPEYFARVMTALYDGLLLQQSLDPRVDVPAYAEAVSQMLTGSLWRQGVAPATD